MLGWSPRGSKRCDTHQQHSPGQFFLLFPVSIEPPTLCSCFLIVQEGERSNPELLDVAPFVLGVNRELGLFCSFTFLFPVPPRHTKLLSSPCACSQPLNSLFPGSGWAGIFYHPALFCIHALIHHILLLLDPCGTCRDKSLELGVRSSALEHLIPS